MDKEKLRERVEKFKPAFKTLVVALILFLTYLSFYTHEKVSSLEKSMNNISLRQDIIELEAGGIVDLSSSSIQEVKGGFKGVGLDAKQHLTGIKLMGRIINPSTVTYRGLEFKVTVSGSAQSIFIQKISPGNSTHFEAYIPDVPLDKTRYARIEYVNGTIHYYAT